MIYLARHREQGLDFHIRLRHSIELSFQKYERFASRVRNGAPALSLRAMFKGPPPPSLPRCSNPRQSLIKYCLSTLVHNARLNCYYNWFTVHFHKERRQHEDFNCRYHPLGFCCPRRSASYLVSSPQCSDHPSFQPFIRNRLTYRLYKAMQPQALSSVHQVAELTVLATRSLPTSSFDATVTSASLVTAMTSKCNHHINSDSQCPELN